MAETSVGLEHFLDFVRNSDPGGRIDVQADVDLAGGRLTWEFTVTRGQLVTETIRRGTDVLHQQKERDASVLAEQFTSGEIKTLASALTPARILRFNPEAIAAPIRVGDTVARSGQGLAAALLDLQNSRRKRFTEIEERLRAMFPWVEEIQMPISTASEDRGPKVRLRFLERGGARSYRAEDVSSGMLIALAILWTTMRPDPDRIICYEEPESSIHPCLLSQIYDLLRKTARGELGAPPVQVLVATHSIDFVNLCEPEEVRICERTEDGSSQVHTIRGRSELQESIDIYRQGKLGEL